MSNFAEDKFSPTHINATFVIKMLANSTTAGKVNATVSVSEEWNWRSSGWQISRENWAYTYFDASYLDVNQGSATTFPQWGVMKMGGDPNLVSDKSIEWHAGPYLAAAVYAFIFGIALVLIVRMRSANGTRAKHIGRVSLGLAAQTGRKSATSAVSRKKGRKGPTLGQSGVICSRQP